MDGKLLMIKPGTGLLAACMVCWLGIHAPGALAEEELIYEGPAQAAVPENDPQDWRVLPGESLQSLAALFYPKSPRMQQRFVSSTIALNREKLANVSPRQPFEQGTTLRIPNLRSLSFQSGSGAATETPPKPVPVAPKKTVAADGKGSPEYSTLTKRHQSRKQELEALNRRLKTLEESSRTMKQQLQPGTLPAMDQPAPKALKRVPAPRIAAPGSESPLQIAFYLLAVMLLLGGGLAYRWHRARIQKPGQPASTAASIPETVAPAAPGSQPAQSQPKSAARQQAAQPDSMSVHEIESVVEEAHVIVALGRTSNAIKLLTDHIERYPRASVNPWFYLLDLYRATGNRADFEATGKRMHATFNVMIPAWDNGNAALAVPSSLEEFPHVIEKINGMWATRECRDYLNHLIEDNRDGERIGFSVPVMQEIILLISVLDALIQK
jgi:hypothetical protein